MSLTASMWTSVSGLLNHGEKMNVVGNNIANTNTVAFKGSRMDFMDYVHSTVFAAGGPTQIGRGVSIGAVYGDFGQGAFESSTESTDMAINGNGFFKVIPKYSNESYYTRAGNFRFDNEGYLCNPQGYVLQGWPVEVAAPSYASGTPQASNSKNGIIGTGVPTDIRLTSFSCEPHHTNNMSIAVNLNQDMGKERTASTTNPFAALFENWDSTQPMPLGQDAYAYQQSMTVYDEGGGAHIITIYFDKVEDNVTNGVNGKNVWEFLVTMDPSEDIRTFWNDGTSTWDAVPADKKGLLMTGTMTFNNNGLMENMMGYVPIGANGAANFDDSSQWVPAPISTNGYPMFAANFSGIEGASCVYDSPWLGGANAPSSTAAGLENPLTRGMLTELNFGYRSVTGWWTGLTATPSLADVGTDYNNLPGMGTAGERQNPASTAYKGSFSERYAKQDGYTYGELTSIHVTDNGVLTGRYSNGVTLELFQITLYDFNAKHELHREGGNMFSQTRESGDPTQGAANTGSFGSILGNNLEQSNVDISREFVQMITTQRGFQSNSKLITTTDTMLENVINMKR